MCYSALVEMRVKELRFTYQARVQIDLFEDLFRSRLGGSGAKIPRALEAGFLEAPRSAPELRIARAIREFRAQEAADARDTLLAQEKRLAAAEKSLLAKVTKKAREDARIAARKIEAARAKIDGIESGRTTEADSRIWPGMYAPLLRSEGGDRTIQPFRYLLRPHGQSREFDRKFGGAYNARRDRLQEVFWWKSLYGKRHGALVIRAFFENVKRHAFERRSLRAGEEEETLVLRFEPDGLREMVVPCIWDRNEADANTLLSFALITDTPNPEVAAAGHDRTPIILKPERLDEWLTPDGGDLAAYEALLDDRLPTYFQHELAA